MTFLPPHARLLPRQYFYTVSAASAEDLKNKDYSCMWLKKPSNTKRFLMENAASFLTGMDPPYPEAAPFLINILF